MAGVAGFEPTMNGSEPFALPLGDTPKQSVRGFVYQTDTPKRSARGFVGQTDTLNSILLYDNLDKKPIKTMRKQNKYSLQT